VTVEVVEALLAALEAQCALGALVTPADLSRPSRCPAWTVSDVLSHSLGVTLKFVEFASGRTDRPRSPTGDLIGDSPERGLRTATDFARSAWSAADMSRACRLPFGTFPAGRAAGINLVDVLAHSWDVGTFGEAGFDCPGEVWSTGLESARNLLARDRDPHHYAGELSVSPSAPPERRFLAYLGRGGPSGGPDA
jgi:uncharacterized protein (TIGR03086 family)